MGACVNAASTRQSSQFLFAMLLESRIFGPVFALILKDRVWGTHLKRAGHSCSTYSRSMSKRQAMAAS